MIMKRNLLHSKEQTINDKICKAKSQTVTPTSTEISLGTCSEDNENVKTELEVVKSNRQFQLGIKSYTSVNLRESLLLNHQF